MVVFGHCYGTSDPLIYICNGSGGLAMPVFFFLSGLLVAQSLDSSPTRLNFLYKRFLRLYPAACVVIILTACVIGPLVSTLSPLAYFSHPLFFKYLTTCLLIKVYHLLPGVFTHFPSPSVNLSLWSLSLELKLYLFLFLASFTRKKTYIPLVAACVFILVITGKFYYAPTEEKLRNVFPAFVFYPYTHVAVYFLTGILTWHYRNHIVIRNYWALIIVIGCAVSMHFRFFDLSAYILVPALVLYAAVSGTGWAHRLTPKPDLSYGIYVWAFLVEELLINYLHLQNGFRLFFLTLLFTVPIALLSWYAVEAPALKMKKRII